MKEESKETIKLWIRLKRSSITDQMKEEMKEFPSQGAYFTHLLKKHYGRRKSIG